MDMDTDCLEPAHVSQLQCRLAVEVSWAEAVLKLADNDPDDANVVWKEAALELAAVVIAHEQILGPMLEMIDEMLGQELADLDVN